VTKKKFLAAAGIAAGALLVTALLAVTFILFSPLPSRRGRIEIPRLFSPVDARFDSQGVPHIRSVLEVDAWRALGFVHAADRMFQMELRRRAAEGRLAELFGPAAVPMDREARINGYLTLARRDLEQLGDEERAALEAYADGVNAFLDQESLPLELRALRLSPEPWTVLDSLAFTRLMEDDLSVADSVERGALEDARARGTAAAASLLDASEPGATAIAPETAAILDAQKPRASGPAGAAASEPVAAGSNAWALSGSRTASGKPILAGDPHLAPERPGVWYAAHLESADGLDVAGLTLAGVPGVVVGHNGRVAWSVTMHQADDSDLFLEQVDWSASSYRRGDTWVPLDRVKETIKVKGGADVVVDVARTGHGPIVQRLDELGGIAVARAFAPADQPQGPRPFLEAARARNAAELLVAWSHFEGPSVNVCYADASGAIGLSVEGAIPRRRHGDGRLPVPGWTGAYDWDGTIPQADLPAIAAPESGFVVTANDDWSDAGRRVPYPGFYADSDRAHRARELASKLSRATARDMRAMQNDVYSAYAARIASAVSSLRFADPRAANAAKVLADWDARVETHGPSRLFFAFLKELRQTVGPASGRVTWSMLERMIEGREAQSFWDDPSTPKIETRAASIERALGRALDTVSREDGTDSSRWSFGAKHRLTYQHPFASALPAALAKRLAFGPVALPGEWHTLDVAGFPLRGEKYDVTHIPSARLIVDLADPDAARLVLPLGQSGQLFDGHGQDQLRAWSSGRDFPLPFTAEAVEAATISTIQFVPGE
jgi:penicillin amidase